jgi:type I restriction-modification system DNA methylase subunit
MAKRKAGTKKAKQATDGQNGGIVALTKELFQAAITLRGSVEPADYKRYVLPIIFLRFLSLRYDRRRAELETLIADKKSDYFSDKKAVHDPDEYRRVGAFVIPEAARWENLRKAAQADDIKVKLDDVLESLEICRIVKQNARVHSLATIHTRGARLGRISEMDRDPNESSQSRTRRKMQTNDDAA